MGLKSFDYFAPQTMEELLDLIDKKTNSKILAGGTDLVVAMRAKAVLPDNVIDLKRVPNVNFIKNDEDTIKIGAATEINKIANSKTIQEYAPYLAEAAKRVGGSQTRNLGTIGGNIVSAVPSADMAPPLMAANAKLVVKSKTGERLVDIEKFFLGPRKTVLQPNEVLTEILIPKYERHCGVFIKFGRRKALTLAIVNLAVAGEKADGENAVFKDIRISLGAVAPTPIRVYEAEDILKGKDLTSDLIEKAAEIAANSARPISDLRASAEYRKTLVNVLLKRALSSLANNCGTQCCSK